MSTENEASGAISTQDGALEMTLGRLSSKPGVLAAMAIDRTTATVLATSGNTSVFSLSSTSTPANSSLSPVGLASPVSDFAAMVWRHVQTTVHLVQAMDTEVSARFLSCEL